MAGIASGICNLAVGTGDARRRQTQAQCCPNGNVPPPAPAPAPAHAPAQSSEEFTYSNAGKQNIKGLTNQTGYVKGNANGVINFGTLTSSARQA
ncbi:uncharacterized protein [Medicago truncatula]|uniref:uncharacterized protein n=1 Tax=Medicago truncatula TaxID=3880 RepID=UPI0000D5D83A|nr:uncharacterized protein LOC11414698 [Medicago truncatula]